jgi:hypothetical protein
MDFANQSELPIDIKLATARKNLTLKSNISNWTKNENQTVSKAIYNMSMVERQKE